MTEPSTADLLSLIKARAAEQERLLVALCGPPAAGKTTLAADLAERLGPEAAVLPMDGFHLDNSTLRQRGLFERKGAPETFDAEGFVELVRALRSTPRLSYPTFDRTTDKTLPNTGHIDENMRIVLVEGNYLLLQDAPWNALAGLFDLTVALHVPLAALEARLIARWRNHGMPEAEAIMRARGNDLRNAAYVLRHSRAAEITLNHPA